MILIESIIANNTHFLVFLGPGAGMCSFVCVLVGCWWLGELPRVFPFIEPKSMLGHCPVPGPSGKD